jgi:hypothetical protein
MLQQVLDALFRMLFEIPPWWRISGQEAYYYLTIVADPLNYRFLALDVGQCRLARVLSCELRYNCNCFNCLGHVGPVLPPLEAEVAVYGWPNHNSSSDESDNEDGAAAPAPQMPPNPLLVQQQQQQQHLDESSTEESAESGVESDVSSVQGNHYYDHL